MVNKEWEMGKAESRRRSFGAYAAPQELIHSITTGTIIGSWPVMQPDDAQIVIKKVYNRKCNVSYRSHRTYLRHEPIFLRRSVRILKTVQTHLIEILSAVSQY